MIDIHALSGAYAVDALDDAERTEFEEHLAECSACQAEVTSLQEAASLLAETTLAAPSSALRARVLAEIASVRPLPPEVTSETAKHARHVAPTAETTTETATVTELAPRRRRRVMPFLAAAAAVIAIGTGGVVYQQVNDDGPSSRTEQVMAAPDAQRITMDLEGGGTATVVRSKSLNEAVITTQGMPDAPDGHSFNLWLGHDGVMKPAGVMPEGPDNTVVLSGDAASADSAAVSVEEAGDEPAAPEGPIVASFSFDA